jgi:environmental stress-induced protein Ves
MRRATLFMFPFLLGAGAWRRSRKGTRDAAGVKLPAAAWGKGPPPVDDASRVIPANEYRRVRWKNNLGWTREIVRVPDADDWSWRLSIAEIERDAPFSSFPGVERELVLLRGHGLRLRFDDGETVELQPPHGRHRFAGERALVGELADGPTHDFNLMWKRDALSAELLHRPLVGSMLFFVEPGTAWAIHLLVGQACFDAGCGLPPLFAGDTAVLASGEGRKRYALDGGGALLAAKLTAL